MQGSPGRAGRRAAPCRAKPRGRRALGASVAPWTWTPPRSHPVCTPCRGASGSPLGLQGSGSISDSDHRATAKTTKMPRVNGHHQMTARRPALLCCGRLSLRQRCAIAEWGAKGTP